MTGSWTSLRNGWVVDFRKNIHMYSHSLKLSKGGETYDVFCEDTPSGFVGIWPYELKVTDGIRQEVFSALREWATQSGLPYRLYTSRDEYETNEKNT